MSLVNESIPGEHQTQSGGRLSNTLDSTAGQAAVLDLRDVSCAYEPTRPAVEGITFSVQHGEILCLLGPSGCGKTTILRAIAGFERVTTGSIALSGRLVSSRDTMIPTEHRHIGMVFQEYALFPHLRVDKNIAFGLRHLSRAQQQTMVDDLLALTGLRGLEHRYPHELSGGQQQRVALARALALRPVLLLLDEPFSNLDPDMAGRMRQDLHALLRQTKTTAILVTHDHDEAFSMADRVAVLNKGRLEQFDTPEAIYHLPSTPFVALPDLRRPTYQVGAITEPCWPGALIIRRWSSSPTISKPLWSPARFAHAGANCYTRRERPSGASGSPYQRPLWHLRVLPRVSSS